MGVVTVKRLRCWREGNEYGVDFRLNEDGDMLIFSVDDGGEYVVNCEEVEQAIDELNESRENDS